MCSSPGTESWNVGGQKQTHFPGWQTFSAVKRRRIHSITKHFVAEIKVILANYMSVGHKVAMDLLSDHAVTYFKKKTVHYMILKCQFDYTCLMKNLSGGRANRGSGF